MRLLLTGASGFLGGHVLNHLRERGIDTVMLGRRRVPDSAFASFIAADLLAAPDFAALVKQAQATHLLHLAWVTEHGKYWASPLNLRWVDATTRLVEAFCAGGGKQVVVAGTCAEYAASTEPCREDHTPLHPSTLYGTAKDATRRLVMAICAQHHVACAWGRVFLLYGRGENRARLFPSLIDVFRGKRAPFAINTLATRDFLHASDVASAFIMLLKSGESGAYNICSGQPTVLGDVVRELARLLNADPQTILKLSAARPGEPPLLVGENRKLKRLGWAPALTLTQGLELTASPPSPSRLDSLSPRERVGVREVGGGRELDIPSPSATAPGVALPPASMQSSIPLPGGEGGTQYCPVCDSHNLTPFLQRRQVPIHQNLIIESRTAAREVTRGDLDFVACRQCGFVYNRAFDLARLAYGEHYDGSQFYSAYYDAHLDAMAKNLVERHGVRNSTIVEVGCGRGQFIRKLVSYPGANNRGVGFDPSYSGAASELDGRLTFRRCFYDHTCTDVAADVVVCRHVIEHVPDPLALLRPVRQALAKSPHARVFFETPCVQWILRNRVVWDFFYEHCSLFTATSLSNTFQRAGFSVQRVDHIFGGQYLWLEAQVSEIAAPALQDCADTAALAQAYGTDEEILRQKWLTRLRALQARGKVALWGAGAKGATFANLIDPLCSLIDCVTDVNPNKQGRYIPGTGHLIVKPTELAARGIKFAVLMNANYREEIQRLLVETNINLELIDWSEV